MTSSAQDSEAKTYASPRRPITSGRSPCGSEATISLSLVISRKAKPPTSWRSASLAASTKSFDERAIKCASTSVSLVVWKMEPLISSCLRISGSLTMLPLVAIARSPSRYLKTSGCALVSRLSPLVE
ncbi:hypothetical protein D3C75_761590 [compost metagenome]